MDRGGTEEASQFLMCKLDMISFKIPFLLTDGNIPSHIISKYDDTIRSLWFCEKAFFMTHSFSKRPHHILMDDA